MPGPRASRLAALALVQALACNAILGNEDRDLAPAGVILPGRSDAAASDAATDRTVPPPDDASPGDAGFDAGPRMPDPTCVKATNPSSNVLRVEIDGTPISDGKNAAALFSIYGNDALTNVRLDFCAPDGAHADVGGGFNYLGAAGGANHRWQTKGTVTLPVGISQAQVIADGTPALKLVMNLELR